MYKCVIGVTEYVTVFTKAQGYNSGFNTIKKPEIHASICTCIIMKI